MSNWSWEEIYSVGHCLHGFRYEDILDTYSHFGPNTTQEFETYTAPRLREYRDRYVQGTINRLARMTAPLLASDLQDLTDENDIMLRLRPAGLYTSFTSIAPKDIAMRLSEAIDKHTGSQTSSEVLKILKRSDPPTQELAGTLYEVLAHRCIQALASLSLQPLDDKHDLTLELFVDGEPKLVHVFTGMTIHEDQYYIPGVPMHNTFHAFYIHGGTVYVFRMALDSEQQREININGLDNLAQMLEPQYRPWNGRPWIFVSVVPSDVLTICKPLRLAETKDVDHDWTSNPSTCANM